MSGLYVGIAGAVLGAGGSVAGGILSKPKSQGSLLPQTYNPASDPLTALNRLDIMASQGVYAPDAILQQSGPVQQAINAFNAKYPTAFSGKALAVQQAIIQSLLAGQETPGGAAIAREFGYNSVGELLAAQKSWEAGIQPHLDTLRQIAGRSDERQLAVENALTQLTKNPLDFGSIRDAELARLNQQLDVQQTGALRAASAGGYNPGRAIEGIGLQRQNADLDAISRAVAALSGVGQNINNLNALNPANRAQSLSPNVVGASTPTVPGGVQFVPNQTSPFGAAVAQAGQQLGGGLQSASLLYALNQSNNAKPGWFGGTTGGGGSEAGTWSY